jgi:hypothetical protein
MCQASVAIEVRGILGLEAWGTISESRLGADACKHISFQSTHSHLPQCRWRDNPNCCCRKKGSAAGDAKGEGGRELKNGGVFCFFAGEISLWQLCLLLVSIYLPTCSRSRRVSVAKSALSRARL